MNILLSSSTFASQVLETVRPLILAYFPAAKVRVVEAGHEQATATPDSVFLAVETAWGYECGLILRWQEQDGEAGPVDCTVRLSEGDIQQIMVQPEIGREDPVKVFLRHGVAKLLTEVSGRELPWGILTGIRPTKLVHRLRDLELSSQQQALVLRHRYGIREDKIERLLEIGLAQEPYLQVMENNPQAVAVYLGIPFCPTRCSYCSFPAYVLGQERHELKEYLAALRAEIIRAGAGMKELGLWADSLYFGGGTPTILTTDEMTELIEFTLTHIPHAKPEFTVEAGRPDTLSEEKLVRLKELGVRRLSINPQTMQERTLQRIGRAHNVAGIGEAFQMARQISDWVINMDLILGLPGESPAEVQDSLEQVAELNPDNLTIHALALKRGSKEKELGYSHPETEKIEQMAMLADQAASRWGLKPYYLYRQKQIAGNLENIGYARPGMECRYNISIMEERQHIIGLGAGATSKVIDFRDYSLQNIQHPGNWQTYIRRWTELDQERWSKLRSSI